MTGYSPLPIDLLQSYPQWTITRAPELSLYPLQHKDLTSEPLNAGIQSLPLQSCQGQQHSQMVQAQVDAQHLRLELSPNPLHLLIYSLLLESGPLILALSGTPPQL